MINYCQYLKFKLPKSIRGAEKITFSDRIINYAKKKAQFKRFAEENINSLQLCFKL